MTTDTDALQERIETALLRATDNGADRTEEYAAAVLPIIAAEVRAAKAEALREAADDAEVRAAAFAVMELDGDRGLDGFTYSHIARAALTAAKEARA